MKRIVAVVLITVLVAPPAWAQQSKKPLDWKRVQRLEPGTRITLTVSRGTTTKALFLYADEATLFTLRTTEPPLSGRVRGVLVRIGSDWPRVLSHAPSRTVDGVRVSDEGVFDGPRKLGDLAELIQQTPRADVLAAREQGEGSHVGRNVLLGLLAAFVAMGIAVRIAYPDN